jgi:hypothetical protein
MGKRRYQVNLSAHMAECDANFHRIQRLLPNLDELDHYAFGVSLAAGKTTVISITVVERSPYTTTLIFSKQAQSPWLAGQDLSVRVYHDAMSAEVMACWRGVQLNSRYSYPNHYMYQEDEKVQLNRFLGEWLRHCLEHGHSLCEIALA